MPWRKGVRSLTDFLGRRLARVTSTGEFIPQVDGLRSLAMVMAFVHHIFAGYLVETHRLGAQQLPRDWGLIYDRSPLVRWALDLAISIPMFCVISGFILSVPFARCYFKGVPAPSRKLYFLRRVIRIEPPYILSMLFLFLVIVFPWRQAHAWVYFHDYFLAFFPHLLASLAYLHAMIYGEASWINGVAWTLEIEIQFYILLPFLAVVFRIGSAGRRRLLLLSAILISALLSQWLVGTPGHSRLSLSLPLQFHFFVAGLLLADIYLDPPSWLRPGPRLLDLLAVSAFALLAMVLHWQPWLAWTEPFLIAAMFFGIFGGAWSGRLFRFPLLTLFGGMGYSIYLYHVFVIDRLLPYSVRLFPPSHALWWDTGVQILVLTPPVLAICVLLFRIGERPFMILSKSVAQRFRAARAAAAPQVR